MSEVQGDWTNWIITTIMAALTTMIGTVVALAKMIETKYVQEIRDLKEDLKDYKVYADKERHELMAKAEECEKDRHTLAIRVAQIEARHNDE